MAFLFVVALPDNSQIQIPVNEDYLPADFFSRLFEYLSINYSVHGLDCTLQEIKDSDQNLIFESNIPLRQLQWSHVRSAIFNHGFLIGKLGAPSIILLKAGKKLSNFY